MDRAEETHQWKITSFTVVGALIAALIGGFFSLLATYIVLDQQQNALNEQQIIEQRNIAQALYYDISRTENGTIEFLEGLGSKNSNETVINVTDLVSSGVIFDIKTPIYKDNGLYFVFQKDISKFDSNLSANIYIYYSKLLSAEHGRQYTHEIVSKDPTGQNLTSLEIADSRIYSTKMLFDLIDSITLAEYSKTELKARYKLNINLAASKEPLFTIKEPSYNGKLSQPVRPFEVKWTPVAVSAKGG
ncbi:MAG: hypothetical protein AB9879_03885 [Methanothrix sp.]